VRSVTLTEVIRRAKKRSDMTGSRFLENQDWVDLFNSAYADLYDLVVGAYDNYYVSEESTTLVTGTDTYDLPDDFYKLIGVDFLVGGTYITLFPFVEAERNQPFAGASSIPSGTIRLRYVPAPAQYTVDDLDEEIDGVAGWDEYVVNLMAEAALTAEESDTTAVQNQLKRLRQRIIDMAPNRDTGMPARITDVFAANNYLGLWDTLRYRLYGNQIRLINAEFTGYYTL
jgi:hypothetical protein